MEDKREGARTVATYAPQTQEDVEKSALPRGAVLAPACSGSTHAAGSRQTAQMAPQPRRHPGRPRDQLWHEIQTGHLELGTEALAAPSLLWTGKWSLGMTEPS